MSFQENYDLMVKLIEQNIGKKPVKINQIICSELYMTNRIVSEIFRFISDYTFADYIGQRRLYYVFDYKNKIKCTWDEAAYQFGEEYTTYYRRFKKQFGISPDEAVKEQRKINFLQPLYFNTLISEDSKKGKNKMQTDNQRNVNKTLRLTYEQYKAFDEIQNYQSLYGFSDEEIIALFNLSQKCNLSLEEVCECREFEKLNESSYYEKREYLSEDILNQTSKLVAKYNYNTAQVYSLVFDGFSEDLIHMIIKHKIPAEDAVQFEKSLNDCNMSWSDVTYEIISLYYTKVDRWFYIGDTLNVADCKGLIEALSAVDVDLSKDPELLLDIMENYEYGEDYVNIVKTYANFLRNSENELDKALASDDMYMDEKDLDSILDAMAYSRGDLM